MCACKNKVWISFRVCIGLLWHIFRFAIKNTFTLLKILLNSMHVYVRCKHVHAYLMLKLFSVHPWCSFPNDTKFHKDMIPLDCNMTVLLYRPKLHVVLYACVPVHVFCMLWCTWMHMNKYIQLRLPMWTSAEFFLTLLSMMESDLCPWQCPWACF